MKVSVLVPVYGVEKYIGRCAESLFGQTYGDIEYVFVDDRTPDRSIDILQSVARRHPLREGQIKIIRHAENRGIGAVRQNLIDNCTGDCLTFVDSDDYLPPRAVELMAAEQARSGADIVDGAWQRVTAEGLSAATPPCQETDERRYLALLLCQNIVSNRLWGRLYRRTLFTRNGVSLAPGVDYCEDYSLITRLMFYASRAFINDTVYYYSDENAASYTHTVSAKHIRSMLKANRAVLDFFTANGVEVDRKGRPVVDDSMATGLANVYAVGDARRGPATVVEAIADATRAAQAIVELDSDKFVGQNICPDYNKPWSKKGAVCADCDSCDDSRCLGCPTVCEVCADVCPNRANVTIAVPGMRQRQIIHVDGMCNECGNCATFCPYESRPYQNKFTLFWSEEDFHNSANEGFLPLEGDVCLVRLDGQVGQYATDDTACGLPEGIRQLIVAVRTSYSYLLA